MTTTQRLIAGVILIAIVGISLSTTLVHLLTEFWWFDSVGFAQVFWTRITWKILLWIATFFLYGLFLWFNYRLAINFTRDRNFYFLQGNPLEPYTESLANLAIFVAIILVASGTASATASAWDVLLKYWQSTDFNLVDPLYKQDVGFYFFRLPLYEGVRSGLLVLCILALLLSILVYGLKGRITAATSWQHLFRGRVKIHLSILAAAIAFLIAIGFWLERYELLYSAEGIVFGAGYTQANAQRLAYGMTSFLSLILGMSFIVAIWQNKFTLPIYGLTIYIITSIVINSTYPWFQQKFIVEPNELEKEKPYIEHNIKFSRQAYGLEVVQREDFPAKNHLDRQILAANQSTIDNIRLWDYRPLLATYRQLQEIRLYYKFNDVDIDRYTFANNYRQVMLSGRELDYNQVPQKAQTWVNQRLKYTHGYGLVMSSVNEVTPAGLPQLLIEDIPPVSKVDLEIKQPGIYYGELTDNYIFTGTKTQEFDYPLGEENAFTNYTGKGGVAIPSIWHRLAYAWDFSSLKLLISNYFINSSRIHYYRQIKQRVNHVAPFLRFDSDPYITVIDGKLKWIIDAYTVSDRFPYAEPVERSNGIGLILEGNNIRKIIQGKVNYLRNSVKILLDAYNGTMQFFVVDEQDPVLATYRKIFPTLFTPSDQIPPAVQAHFRYPLDLFKIQSQMYSSYHMSDPQVFYNQEDLWRLPKELYEGNEQIVQPYYTIMRLPEESSEEFVLILPFTPVNKNNMIAWMAARSDGEDYGKLLLYEFPKQQLVYGPSQIEARVDQNPEISQQLTLWSQEGSRVIRGNLLVIPIERSLLYVEPIYLRAEQGQLPELKRVIVSYNNQTVMEKTLQDSLAVIFGEKQAQTQTSTVPSPTQADSTLLQKSLETYQKAENALRQGDWASYGKYQEELGKLLQQLNQKPEQQRLKSE